MRQEQDPLQQALWCTWRVISLSRKIKKPRQPVGLIVSQMNAAVELQLLLELQEEVNKMNFEEGGPMTALS